MKKSKKKSPKKSSSRQINPVVHFEMPVADRERASYFYTNAFGWEMQGLGEGMGNYVLATTAGAVDKKGRPKLKGVINGGFYTRNELAPAQYPNVVIAVDDIKKYMSKIAVAGGNIIGQPMEIPGQGIYVSFYDTEGNRVSIIAPVMKAKAKARKK